jgi:hypothetical protein
MSCTPKAPQAPLRKRPIGRYAKRQDKAGRQLAWTWQTSLSPTVRPWSVTAGKASGTFLSLECQAENTALRASFTNKDMTAKWFPHFMSE